MTENTQDTLDTQDAPAVELPPDQLEALRRFIVRGILPGHFLTAVLCNDLQEAVAHADRINRRLLGEYVVWLVNYAPSGCWGSNAHVTKWAAARRTAWQESQGLRGER